MSKSTLPRRPTRNRQGYRSKPCDFCLKGAQYIDYKDYPILKSFTDYFGNIRRRCETGLCLKHQKMLKTAVERARFMGMLAYRK